MGVTLSAGGSLSWWRETLGGDFDDLVGEASGVPPGSEGLLFLPYLSGERTPHLDPRARGAFFGLTARHGAAHMTRAVMEGVIFSLRDSLEILRELGVPIDDVRATGGGARSGLWRQLQADIYATPIRRTVADEGPAYGAALLAGVASGTYADVEEATSVVKLREEITEPNPERSKIYEEYYEIYRSLYPATSSAMSRLDGSRRRFDRPVTRGGIVDGCAEPGPEVGARFPGVSARPDLLIPRSGSRCCPARSRRSGRSS